MRTALLILLAGCAATDEPALRLVTPSAEVDSPAERATAVGDDDDAASPPDVVDAIPASARALVDVTVERGLDFESPGWAPDELPLAVEDQANGGGGALADLDGDGDLDLVLTAPRGGNAVYLRGESGFERVPESGIEGIEGSSCVVAVDLDGDRLPELLLGARHRVLVFAGEGGGRFAARGVAAELTPGAGVEGIAAADVDGDGHVDLYVSAQGRHVSGELPGELWGADDQLLRGLGGGAFEDVSALAPPEALGGQSFAATWLDADADGDLDLYSVKDRGAMLVPARLLINPGDLDSPWTEQAEAWGMALGGDGMGIAAGDVDGDGRLEVLQSDNWGRLPLLSLDAEQRSAVRVDAAWGLAPYADDEQVTSWGPLLEDLDNDGDLDALVVFGRIGFGSDARAQSTGLWLWEGDGFAGRPDLLQLDHPTAPDGLRSPLAGDVDGDGALDVVLTAHTGSPILLEGEPSGWHWLSVRLDGVPGNRDGLGAEVLVEAGGRTLRRRVQAGGQGVHSSGPPIAWFGLGAAEEVDRLTVRWPDGALSEWADVPIDAAVVADHP